MANCPWPSASTAATLPRWRLFCSVLLSAVALSAVEGVKVESYPRSEAEVLQRMRYWVPAKRALPPTDKYVLFSVDVGGPNNIRLGWEMTGIVALGTGRTLVLPPASSMYLLDWGPRSERFLGKGFGPRHWEDAGHLDTTTLVEDLLNLKQLKAHVPTLTWDEFAARTGLTWDEAVAEASTFPSRGSRCDMDVYKRVGERILFMGGDDQEGDREGFSCSEWFKLGAPAEPMKGQMGEPGWAVLQHGFVWHEDAFRIAAKAVAYLGMYQYNAVHLRYGDFQFLQMDSGRVMLKWGDILSRSPRKTLYLATDEPQKARKMLKEDGKQLSIITWDDLFDPERTGALLAPLRAKYTDERWFKLTGLVEELICSSARIFVGSQDSTFSGHIHRMRRQAQAPVPLPLYTKLDPGKQPGLREDLHKALKKWDSHGLAGAARVPKEDAGMTFAKQRHADLV